MTTLLLYVFSGIAFVLTLSWLTWAAAQAGAGREFARMGFESKLDIMDAFHEEFMNRCDRTLAGIS
jgi:hypothetical protein